jgi:hypothetical protein
MPPRCASHRAVRCAHSLRRVLPPAIWLAVVVLLAPELSGAAAMSIAALVWRRHHPDPRR